MVLLRAIRKLLLLPQTIAESIEDRTKRGRCAMGEGARLHAGSRIWNLQAGKDAITIGPGSHILGQLTTFPHGGEIRIGQESYVGEDSRVWSAAKVTIGDRVQISHGVNIHDTNAHSLSAESRFRHFQQIMATGHPAMLEDVKAVPIVIEDDVWIGFNATVLKGITIGRGAVVAAGSVVTRDVEPFAIVAGNPARVVGQSRP